MRRQALRISRKPRTSDDERRVGPRGRVRNAAASRRLLSVFYVHACHALFLAPPGSRVQSTTSCYPLAALTDVLLGKQKDWSAKPLQNPLGADFFPEVGYNSVKGCIVYNGVLREMEYIVYRYGQAKPRYLLRFNL